MLKFKQFLINTLDEDHHDSRDSLDIDKAHEKGDKKKEAFLDQKIRARKDRMKHHKKYVPSDENDRDIIAMAKAGREGDKAKEIALAKKVLARSKRMQEDLDQLDELSKNKLAMYIHRAVRDVGDKNYAAGSDDAHRQYKYSRKKLLQAMKRRNGIDNATDKLTGNSKVPATESYDQLDELDKPTLARYVTRAVDDRDERRDAHRTHTHRYFKNKDFASDAKKSGDKVSASYHDAVAKSNFNDAQHNLNKSSQRKKGINMALKRLGGIKKPDPMKIKHSRVEINPSPAIEILKQKNKSLRKEDVDQLVELSKNKLGRYINKSSEDAARAEYKAGVDNASAHQKFRDHEEYLRKTANEKLAKSRKRREGIATATNKLTGNSKVPATESYEHLDEISPRLVTRTAKEITKRIHKNQDDLAANSRETDQDKQKWSKDFKTRTNLQRKINRLDKNYNPLDGVKKQKTFKEFFSELSDPKLATYVSSAIDSKNKHSNEFNQHMKKFDKQRKAGKSTTQAGMKSDDSLRKIGNRKTGIKTAVNKLKQRGSLDHLKLGSKTHKEDIDNIDETSFNKLSAYYNKSKKHSDDLQKKQDALFDREKDRGHLKTTEVIKIGRLDKTKNKRKDGQTLARLKMSGKAKVNAKE